MWLLATILDDTAMKNKVSIEIYSLEIVSEDKLSRITFMKFCFPCYSRHIAMTEGRVNIVLNF